MAMTVMHNAGAQLSLGELNKNINKAGKALARASKGERLVDAGDGDSSAYAISERMREQIRSLLQDNQNVQNGSSLLKVAERGIDQIVEELRTLKELAIDAANDSNTDEDRRTMQKEFDSRIATIDEIAIGTEYNGKILLDGRWSRGGMVALSGGGGGTNTNVTNLLASISAGTGASASPKMISNSRDDGNGNYIPNSPAWSFDVDKSFDGYNFSVNLDFSGMQTSGSYPSALHNQGFTVLCGGCMQYINVRFDSSRAAEDSEYDNTPGVADDGSVNRQAREFIIGVKDVTTPSDLAEAILTGAYANRDKIGAYSGMSNTSDDTQFDINHNLRIKRDPNNSANIILTKNSVAMQFKEGTIPNPLIPPIQPAKVEEKPWRPLWIQHGTQAGQRVNVYINSMQTKDLGVDILKVTTKELALSSINKIESALTTALDEATYLGSWLNRLEYTDSNITTMGENVQNAESTIRDADMAKEITEYTKYNILTQSSQAMLAQANQNQSSILSLLQ